MFTFEEGRQVSVVDITDIATTAKSHVLTCESQDGSIIKVLVPNHKNFACPKLNSKGQLTVEWVLAGTTFDTVDKDGKPAVGTYTKDHYKFHDFTVSKSAKREIKSEDEVANILSDAKALQKSVDKDFGGSTEKLLAAMSLAKQLRDAYQPKSASYVEPVEQEDDEPVSTGVPSIL